jgi:hypothetical protein
MTRQGCWSAMKRAFSKKARSQNWLPACFGALWTNGSAKKPFYPYIPVSVPFHLHQTAQPDL